MKESDIDLYMDIVDIVFGIWCFLPHTHPSVSELFILKSCFTFIVLWFADSLVRNQMMVYLCDSAL